MPYIFFDAFETYGDKWFHAKFFTQLAYVCIHLFVCLRLSLILILLSMAFLA